MRATDVARLRAVVEAVAVIKKELKRGPYQHPSVVFPLGEAREKISELEDWLEDALYIVEGSE